MRSDINSQTAQSCFTDGQAQHRAGNLVQAERQYRAALAADDSHADSMEWLGVLCLQNGRIEEAVRWFGDAAQLRPEMATFHDNHAAALVRARRPEDAVEALRRSLAAAPEAIEAKVHLGDLLLQLHRYGEAMAMYKAAADADPVLRQQCRDPALLPNEEQRDAVILENCRHILARYPRYAHIHYSMACALERAGRLEEACVASERAVVLNPTLPAYYHALVNYGTPAQKAAATASLEQLEAQEAAVPQDGAAILHFQLAKIREEQGKIGEAFAHLEKANALKRGLIVYDEADELGRMRAIAEIFTPEMMQEKRGGYKTTQPVFVVGMPRSGTTLVEQILASHPDIYGAGELTLLPDLVRQGAAGEDYPVGFAALTAEDLTRLGELYAEQLHAIAPDAVRIVDKLPLNGLHLGLIHLMLPEARIIHVQRDPLDTCFSCFGLMFAGNVGFAYDMGELGHYCHAYEALMAHWRAVLPEGAMLELRYEDVVNDLEGQSRRMIDYCGLPWDAACLDFYKTKRPVATASLAQVRQPVYRHAIGRAAGYGHYIEPLRRALKASPSCEDAGRLPKFPERG